MLEETNARTEGVFANEMRVCFLLLLLLSRVYGLKHFFFSVEKMNDQMRGSFYNRVYGLQQKKNWMKEMNNQMRGSF